MSSHALQFITPSQILLETFPQTHLFTSNLPSKVFWFSILCKFITTNVLSLILELLGASSLVTLRPKKGYKFNNSAIKKMYISMDHLNGKFVLLSQYFTITRVDSSSETSQNMSYKTSPNLSSKTSPDSSSKASSDLTQSSKLKPNLVKVNGTTTKHKNRDIFIG